MLITMITRLLCMLKQQNKNNEFFMIPKNKEFSSSQISIHIDE